MVAPKSERLQCLCCVAVVANDLAKELTGRRRKLAYRVKAEALSVLILEGSAVPNGIRSDGTVGLTLLGTDARLHVPMACLVPGAVDLVRQLTEHSPAVVPLGELVREEL